MPEMRSQTTEGCDGCWYVHRLASEVRPRDVRACTPPCQWVCSRESGTEEVGHVRGSIAAERHPHSIHPPSSFCFRARPQPMTGIAGWNTHLAFPGYSGNPGRQAASCRNPIPVSPHAPDHKHALALGGRVCIPGYLCCECARGRRRAAGRLSRRTLPRNTGGMVCQEAVWHGTRIRNPWAGLPKLMSLWAYRLIAVPPSVHTSSPSQHTPRLTRHLDAP